MANTTVSVRLPDEIRARLESTAKTLRRSRSFLVQEALDRYLDEVAGIEADRSAKGITRLRAMAGAGARLVGAQTMEEIDARIREFRGDE